MVEFRRANARGVKADCQLQEDLKYVSHSALISSKLLVSSQKTYFSIKKEVAKEAADSFARNSHLEPSRINFRLSLILILGEGRMRRSGF